MFFFMNVWRNILKYFANGIKRNWSMFLKQAIFVFVYSGMWWRLNITPLKCEFVYGEIYGYLHIYMDIWAELWIFREVQFQLKNKDNYDRLKLKW